MTLWILGWFFVAIRVTVPFFYPPAKMIPVKLSLCLAQLSTSLFINKKGKFAFKCEDQLIHSVDIEHRCGKCPSLVCVEQTNLIMMRPSFRPLNRYLLFTDQTWKIVCIIRAYPACCGKASKLKIGIWFSGHFENRWPLFPPSRTKFRTFWNLLNKIMF